MALKLVPARETFLSKLECEDPEAELGRMVTLLVPLLDEIHQFLVRCPHPPAPSPFVHNALHQHPKLPVPLVFYGVGYGSHAMQVSINQDDPGKV
jgi:hypothetical protein